MRPFQDRECYKLSCFFAFNRIQTSFQNVFNDDVIILFIAKMDRFKMSKLIKSYTMCRSRRSCNIFNLRLTLLGVFINLLQLTSITILIVYCNMENTDYIIQEYINNNSIEILWVLYSQITRRLQDHLLVLLVLDLPDWHCRVEEYELWLQHYLDYDFFQLFRMCKETFVRLLTEIDGPDLNKPYLGSGIPISSSKQLMMTLWWLGKGEVLLSVSDKFNVAISSVHKSTELILEKLINLKNTYIVWPNADELIYIEEQFREKSGYPGVIGAIDGCHVKFKAPTNQQESYIDKNFDHSIQLQGIVVVNKLFTNIMVGFPGSVHDARVFRNSGIYLDVTVNNKLRQYFPLHEYHLLGDKPYPLLNWLITPYKDHGHLTRRQRNHNTHHSKTRIVVEHVFGLVKCRFRILKYINVNSVEKAIKIIAACCILHNYCYINVDFWDEEINNEENDDHDENENLRYAENTAILKRNEIARIF